MKRELKNLAIDLFVTIEPAEMIKEFNTTEFTTLLSYIPPTEFFKTYMTEYLNKLCYDERYEYCAILHKFILKCEARDKMKRVP